MAKDQTPIFSKAEPGKLITSEDWNLIQRELRFALRHHKHTIDDPVNDAGDLDDAVQIKTEEIANNAVTADKLADKSVTATKIANGAVETDRLADQSVTDAKLADGAVGTGKLADKSVTAAKIADDVVTGIDDGAVTTPKIANAAVTTPKLANDAVTSDKLASNVVSSLAEQIVKLLSEPPKWIFPQLKREWATPPKDEIFNFSPVGYYKDKLGFVRLKGGAATAFDQFKELMLFILPPGYRPANDLIFPARVLSNPVVDPESQIMAYSFCIIRPKGDIYIYSGPGQNRFGNASVFLDNISFFAES